MTKPIIKVKIALDQPGTQLKRELFSKEHPQAEKLIEDANRCLRLANGREIMISEGGRFLSKEEALESLSCDKVAVDAVQAGQELQSYRPAAVEDDILKLTQTDDGRFVVSLIHTYETGRSQMVSTYEGVADGEIPKSLPTSTSKAIMTSETIEFEIESEADFYTLVGELPHRKAQNQPFDFNAIQTSLRNDVDIKIWKAGIKTNVYSPRASSGPNAARLSEMLKSAPQAVDKEFPEPADQAMWTGVVMGGSEGLYATILKGLDNGKPEAEEQLATLILANMKKLNGGNPNIPADKIRQYYSDTLLAFAKTLGVRRSE